MPPKNAKNRSPRWAFMQRLDIPSQEDPSKVYLRRRRIVQTPWFGVYLHHIYLPDGDRDPHNHPWPFATLVLRGGYVERLYRNPGSPMPRFTRQTWRRFTLHRMRQDSAHRITELFDRTVTLVFVGPRRSSWGFFTPTGYVDWTLYPEAGLGPDPFGLGR